MKSGRKIDISKSALISLKAELSRKQEEVITAKAQAQAQSIHPVPRPKKQTLSTKTNAGVCERAAKDVEDTEEEQDALKKSRAALEAKSELYDRLSRDSSVTAVDTKYLVNFQQKVSDDYNKIGETSNMKGPEEDQEDEEHLSDEYDEPLDPEEDWVDYVDCLGRTRRCLRKDLAYVKQRDVELFESVGGFDDKNKANGDDNGPTVTRGDGALELMSGDMRRELLRQKWEQQEEQLRNKTDVHYQDVLFDEARAHGVGYYEFSHDEAERSAQQDALSKLRKETKREQVVAQRLRERREQQMQARLKAARQRKRARMGLPPEEEEPETPVQAEEMEEASESEKEMVEPEPQRQPQPTKRKQPQVRPWDIGKEVMSQEDWVEKKRSERPHEFAPPTSYRPDYVPNPAAVLPEKPKAVLFFSSKKPSNTATNIADRGAERSDVRIKDRDVHACPASYLDDVSSSGRVKRVWGSGLHKTGMEDNEQVVCGKGAEIAPPATFEYCCPSFSGAGQKRSKPNMNDIESSITAGLKYLRQQAEERESQRERGLLDIV